MVLLWNIVKSKKRKNNSHWLKSLFSWFNRKEKKPTFVSSINQILSILTLIHWFILITFEWISLLISRFQSNIVFVYFFSSLLFYLFNVKQNKVFVVIELDDAKRKMKFIPTILFIFLLSSLHSTRKLIISSFFYFVSFSFQAFLFLKKCKKKYICPDVYRDAFNCNSRSVREGEI